MPSAIPRRDVSTTWAPHHCGATHPAAAKCPPLDMWLVAGVPAKYLPLCTCPAGALDHAEDCPRRSAIRAGAARQFNQPPAAATRGFLADLEDTE